MSSCQTCENNKAGFVCGACGDTAYCNEMCQRADFELHNTFECIGKRAKLSKSQRAKFRRVMREFERGELHSGSKKGPIVHSRDQALAIAYSEARKV